MRTSRLARPIATFAIAGLALTGIAACSSDEPEEETTVEETEAAEEPTEDATEEETEEPTEDATDEDDAEAAPGDGAEWANPVTTPGDLLTTIEGDSFSVEVYQVGTTTSPKDGLSVDPEQNLPIIAEGDEIVFVNYVITNTSDEPMPMSFNLVSVDAVYADWPYLGGMDTITGKDLYEAMDVNDTALAVGGPDAPFVLEPGAQFSYGENFKYQAGSAITFDATYTPADDAGELLHDDRQEATADATIS